MTKFWQKKKKKNAEKTPKEQIKKNMVMELVLKENPLQKQGMVTSLISGRFLPRLCTKPMRPKGPVMIVRRSWPDLIAKATRALSPWWFFGGFPIDLLYFQVDQVVLPLLIHLIHLDHCESPRASGLIWGRGHVRDTHSLPFFFNAPPLGKKKKEILGSPSKPR